MCTSNPNPKTTIHGWFDETSSSFPFQLLMQFIKISDPSAIDCMVGFSDPWDQQTPPRKKKKKKRKHAKNGYEFSICIWKGNSCNFQVLLHATPCSIIEWACSYCNSQHCSFVRNVLCQMKYCWSNCTFVMCIIMVYRAITIYTHMVSKFAKLYWTSLACRFQFSTQI